MATKEKFEDKFKNTLILPSRRWNHIIEEHPEVESYKNRLGDVLSKPDLIKKSKRNKAGPKPGTGSQRERAGRIKASGSGAASKTAGKSSSGSPSSDHTCFIDAVWSIATTGNQ